VASRWKSPETDFFPVTGNGWALIALEAWRRGISLRLLRDRGFRLNFEGTEVSFKLSRLDQDSAREANRIVGNKDATKNLLSRNSVKTPRGKAFTAPFNREDIRSTAQSIGFPVALKANSWSKGRGVYSKVENMQDFRYYLDTLIDDLDCKHLLVEEHVRGTDFRYYVAGDQVIGVIRKVRAHVIGDGYSTVRELIEQKNSARKLNPYLRHAPIRMDSEVERLIDAAGLTEESVPTDEQLIYLREKSNVSAGGDSVDYTEMASTKTKQLAIDSIAALPGVSHGGVDIIVENPGTEEETAAVLEINAAAELGLHLFPAEGAPRDIPGALIDHYFPGTSHLQGQSSFWYFDFKSAVAPILKGVAAEVEVVSIPKRVLDQWVTVRYQGVVQRVGFRNWVSDRARAAGVHGKVSNASDGSVVAYLCGTRRGIEKLVSDRGGLPRSASISEVTLEEADPFIVTPGVSIA